mmetsp:Transcript_60184/g.136061  ORF Transcript_60184/g.136061 Transcript_60184/m.136061 type:complete len:207 (-) Transcript_60184:75-695(-)
MPSPLVSAARAYLPSPCPRAPVPAPHPPFCHLPLKSSHDLASSSLSFVPPLSLTNHANPRYSACLHPPMEPALFPQRRRPSSAHRACLQGLAPPPCCVSAIHAAPLSDARPVLNPPVLSPQLATAYLQPMPADAPPPPPPSAPPLYFSEPLQVLLSSAPPPPPPPLISAPAPALPSPSESPHPLPASLPPSRRGHESRRGCRPPWG